MPFNIPLPVGATGADPATLGAMGQGLGARMSGGDMGYRAGRQAGGGRHRQGGIPTVPLAQQSGGMGLAPITTAGQQWDRQQSFYEEYNLKRLAQFDRDLDQAIQLAEMQAASAANVAQIYASAGMAEAAAAAQAKVEAANIAAQAMRDVARMDNATRLQIANLQAEVERERIEVDRRIQESREFGQPINLASYIHYMTQGPGTAVPGVLPQQPAPQVPTAAPTAAGPMASLYQMGMPGQTQLGTPAAIVGEGGPELATTTPQGVQVTPIASQQVKPLQQMFGVPGMRQGGTIGGAYTGPGGTTYRPSGGYTAGIRGTQTATPRAGAISTPTSVKTPPTTPKSIPSYKTPPKKDKGETPKGAKVDWQAFIDQLYGNVPAYSWTGGLELPELGVTLPYAPYGQNVTDWARLPWQVQQGKLSMWRALGIMPETAMGMMYAAAPTGIAQPVVSRG